MPFPVRPRYHICEHRQGKFTTLIRQYQTTNNITSAHTREFSAPLQSSNAELIYRDDMCLYPTLIENPRYKHGGKYEPFCKDDRLRYVAIGCGQCWECRRKKVREWRMRLEWEQKTNPVTGMGITLTFSDESLKKLPKDIHKCTQKAIELFRKRWWAEKKRAIRYWLINEMGHEGTERLHLHGIVWEKDLHDIERIWNYGFVTIETVSDYGYFLKYVNKVDKRHPGFFPKIHCSPGLGKGFTNSETFKQYKREGVNSKNYIRLSTGVKIDIPIYYRNKMFQRKEREEKWLQLLDQQKRYVRGVEFDISTPEGMKAVDRALRQAQKETEALGYPKNPWNRQKYLTTHKKIEKYDDFTL